MKMKSIRSKIVFLLTCSVVIISITMGIVSCALNFRTSMVVMEETLTDTSTVAANQVAEAVEAKLNIVLEAGELSRLTSASISVEDKQALIEQKVKTFGFSSGGITDRSGKSLFDSSLDYSKEAFFQAAMRGETYVSDPIEDKNTGKLALLMTAPLWKEGVPNTTAEGMVYFVLQPDFLNNLVNSITIGKNGTAYIIDSRGTTIAYNDDQIVQDRYNTQEEAKKDPSLAPLAQLEARMMSQETGFGQYTYGGVTKVMAFSPVPDSNGWSLTVCAGRNEFLDGVYRSILLTVLLIAVFLAAGILAAVIFGGRIARPVTLCADRLELLAQGDLKSQVPEVKSRDETGRLAGATRTIVTTLEQIVSDMGWCLRELAQGNFMADSRQKELYMGNFRPMLDSLEQITRQLTQTLYQVRQAAEEVSGGSSQVSAGAQALSQGTTEQASSVEELAATISEISEQVNDTAQNAITAREQTSEAGKEVLVCNEQMQQMIAAMDEISGKSNEIGKIIKAIEDIAFQTNILALNAAVEAARAGEAGKGFAVVADEVRNLAGKSSDASKDTSVLIEDSIKAVERGVQIVNRTAESLTQMVEGTRMVSDTVNRIADAAKEQAESISQVTQGIDQISSVVQTNSATAEESAAASETLSGQAHMLKELVERFKLRNS